MLNFRKRKKPVGWFGLSYRTRKTVLGTSQSRAGYGFVWRMGRGSEHRMSGPARQRTLCSEVEFSGVGLHSGSQCRITLRPAGVDEGIVFRRTDLQIAENIVLASPENVVAADHGTTLANASGARIATVEHLMAALALCSVDNVLIDVDGPEIPILDGSSAQFVSEIASAGCAELPAQRRPVAIYAPMRVGEGDRFIEFTPGPRRLKIEIAFENCLIGAQALSLNLDDDHDLAKLASARTFCRLEEVEDLRKAGLIRGGTLANSIVVDGDRVLNDGPLRDPLEFVLHKALDLIGDLYLLGAPINGSIRAVRPGHAINTRGACALLREAGILAAAEPDNAAIRATA